MRCLKLAKIESLEKKTEQKLAHMVGALGGECYKMDASLYAGMPDRIVLLPKGKVGFVEVKRVGEKPREIQKVRIKRLQALGFKVFVLDNADDVCRVLSEIKEGI